MIVRVAFYKGKKRLFNRIVSWWTRSPYSHCELIFGLPTANGYECWSASFMDGGVRCKLMWLDAEHWDVVRVPVSSEQADMAEAWFKRHNGEKYDVRGILGFIWGPIKDSRRGWFCSEAVAEAMGFFGWRPKPSDLFAVLSNLQPLFYWKNSSSAPAIAEPAPDMT